MRSTVKFAMPSAMLMLVAGCATTADFTAQTTAPKCSVHQVVMQPETIQEHTGELVYLPDYSKALERFPNHGVARHKGEPARKSLIGPAKVHDFVCATCSLEWEQYWASSRSPRTAYQQAPHSN